ncbi:hypothetical protein FACS1894151_03570 [Spirochaetia bacterium]|nr:hypothetical protein FACS1894151_03570 [Spirochaetia bacterium]
MDADDRRANPPCPKKYYSTGNIRIRNVAPAGRTPGKGAWMRRQGAKTARREEAWMPTTAGRIRLARKRF